MPSFVPGKSVGRYRLSEILGSGAFGTVYLGFDDELQRKVAIKVPHPECVRTERDIEDYIREARTVAQLEHDGIAAVHDVGRNEDGLCYVVSRFIDGESLSLKLKSQPPTIHRAVEIVASVADTLEYVHSQSVVHRDIKPGNLLISVDDRVYVTDFGLALRDHQLLNYREISGTPKYMSPEQARGESHLVDGRSDIFSLGVLLYKLITRADPFTGSDSEAILRSIVHDAPTAPRELNPAIPASLERVCLKALSKSLGHRYARASLFARDLRKVSLDDVSAESVPTVSVDQPTQLVKSGDLLTGVTPKGLRSFDVADARFFVKLLPGPLDADGLPESLQFWKTRIECSKAAETFRGGVIDGPSGCGKSSLVKAGLLPQLDGRIDALFLEATPDQTERRLQARLSELGHAAAGLSLRERLQTIRNDRDSTGKTLIVIDQFEQWLHAKEDPGQSDLAAALRQCDGEKLQCLLLVRDDFWLAVSRFMDCLDIDLAQNQNMRLVDLFDPLHARRVLAEFGTGYDRLPAVMSELTKEQNQFLDTAIQGLQENDKIIPVRLALFAEMVKGRPWTNASLEQLGGIEGVGTRFLEECFENSTAPAEQRVHRNAVRSTLMSLLPDHGGDIKGGMKSYPELLEASGYTQQPDQFRQLLRILDTNLRLITPTDPMGLSPGESSEQSGIRFYQLTHDFLVPAIREWVTATQRSTRRGRAELLLRDLSKSSNARHDRRSLPGWLEWVQIQLLTDRQRWTKLQAEVITAATRRFATIAAGCLAVVGITTFAIYEYTGRAQANALVAQLSTADVRDAPAILSQLKSYQRWAAGPLAGLRDDPESNDRERLLASLALLPTRPSEAEFLRTQLLVCRAEERPLLLQALASDEDEIVAELWTSVREGDCTAGEQFRAALVLAEYDPPTGSNAKQWDRVIPNVTDGLIDSVTYDRQSYPVVLAAAAPLSQKLAAPLLEKVRDVDVDPIQKIMARQLLLDLLTDKPQQLADLLLSASVEDVLRTLPALEPHRNQTYSVYRSAVTVGYEDTLSTEEWSERARRQSMAATLLLRDRHTQDVWDVFRQSAQPDARTYLIHRVRPLGVDPQLLLARLLKERDVGIRSGLALALGEYPFGEIEHPDAIVNTLRELYKSHPSAQLHAAVQWLLGRWLGLDYVASISLEASDLSDEDSEPSNSTQSEWRQGPVGMTMVRVEPIDDELPPFEISSTEICIDQISEILTGYRYEEEYAESDKCAAFSVSWFDAVKFCRQLTTAAGLPDDQQCYEIVESPDQYQLRADYMSRRGFRLPTVAEWAAALIGDAESTYPFGNDVQLISNYEWVADDNKKTTSKVPGQKKPNGLGLFDMNGNLTEWCSELSYKTQQRPIRGGTRNTGLPMYVDNPGMTGQIVPHIRWRSYGFRVVRSIVPESE